mmetsp:Transcript_62564/g.129980  ORF Transcript_62564/g.129980 Transcript_62564/m.129980 type:complete len:228 (-) Transcript_62564:674-1357(-)
MAVPLPARAIPSTKWWLTFAPTPREKTRTAPEEHSRPRRLNTSFSLATCPSVRTNTWRCPLGGLLPRMRCSGLRICVPPKSAFIVRTYSDAAARELSSYLLGVRKSVSTLEPKPTMLNVHEGGSDLRKSCSASRASSICVFPGEAMAPIDPLLSMTKMISRGTSLNSISGKRVTSPATPPSLSISKQARGWCGFDSSHRITKSLVRDTFVKVTSPLVPEHATTMSPS